MRTYKTIIPEAKPREVVDVITCDICGKPAADSQGDATGWTSKNYGVDMVQVTREVGNSFPEGCFTTTEAFDICGGCWESKLKPWMASQGAAPRVRESEA